MFDHKVFVYLFKSSFMPLNAVFAGFYTEEIDFLKAEIDFLLNVTCFFFKTALWNSISPCMKSISCWQNVVFCLFMLVLVSYFLHFINIIGSRMLIGLKEPNP